VKLIAQDRSDMSFCYVESEAIIQIISILLISVALFPFQRNKINSQTKESK
jgi:hypothetical protein